MDTLGPIYKSKEIIFSVLYKIWYLIWNLKT
jgi:hypothetical protein